MTDARGSGERYGWLMVVLGFLSLSFAFSARAALGLAMPVWERQLGWSGGFISSCGALALLVMAMVAPIAGNLVDRKGPRPLLGGGLLMIGAGMLLVAEAEQPWLLLLGFSLIAALGFGTVASHIVATAVSGAIVRRRGLAVGLATSGSTAGQLLIVPLLALLLAGGGWRLAFVALGVVALAAGIFALIVMPRSRPGEQTRQAAEPLRQRLSLLGRSPVFHALFWSFTLCGFTTTGVIETHLLPYAASCGFAPLPAATAYGVLSATNLGGMILAGHLSDRVNRPLLLGAIYLLRAACFVLLLLVPGDIRLFYLFALLFGIFDYSTVPATASLVASRLGLGVMGLAMGLISAGHALGGAIGAFLGGVIFDLFARYAWLWIASLGLAVAAGLLVLLIRETRPGPVRVAA